MILLPGWGRAGSVLVDRAFVVALILEYGERLIHAEEDLARASQERAAGGSKEGEPSLALQPPCNPGENPGFGAGGVDSPDPRRYWAKVVDRAGIEPAAS